MNPASQVEELSIHHEVNLPLAVFCLVHLTNLRVNGTPFVAPVNGNDALISIGLSPLGSRLNQLRVLSLVATSASHFPSQALAQLTNITFLQMENCGLKEIPSTISALKKLQELRLAKNQITTMPQTAGNVHRLLTRQHQADSCKRKYRLLFVPL